MRDGGIYQYLHRLGAGCHQRRSLLPEESVQRVLPGRGAVEHGERVAGAAMAVPGRDEPAVQNHAGRDNGVLPSGADARAEQMRAAEHVEPGGAVGRLHVSWAI